MLVHWPIGEIFPILHIICANVAREGMTKCQMFKIFELMRKFHFKSLIPAIIYFSSNWNERSEKNYNSPWFMREDLEIFHGLSHPRKLGEMEYSEAEWNVANFPGCHKP